MKLLGNDHTRTQIPNKVLGTMAEYKTSFYFMRSRMRGFGMFSMVLIRKNILIETTVV